MKFKHLALIAILTLQSCSSIPKEIENTQCSDMDQEFHWRYSLFEPLSYGQAKARNTVSLYTVSKLNEPSVFTEIVRAVENARKGEDLIAVDLRYYKQVNLGNIVVSNLPNDIELSAFLQTSKFSQGFFALINFGKDGVTIIPPRTHKDLFERVKIDRGDLFGAELVLNVSKSDRIMGNMKFSKYQEVSIIADEIKEPYRLDVREATNMQHNLDYKWIMSVYSIKGSNLMGGKDTTGLFKYVNNEGVKNIDLQKFDKSEVLCYKDPHGLKLL